MMINANTFWQEFILVKLYHYMISLYVMLHSSVKVIFTEIVKSQLFIMTSCNIIIW